MQAATHSAPSSFTDTSKLTQGRHSPRPTIGIGKIQGVWSQWRNPLESIQRQTARSSKLPKINGYIWKLLAIVALSVLYFPLLSFVAAILYALVAVLLPIGAVGGAFYSVYRSSSTDNNPSQMGVLNERTATDTFPSTSNATQEAQEQRSTSSAVGGTQKGMWSQVQNLLALTQCWSAFSNKLSKIGKSHVLKFLAVAILSIFYFLLLDIVMAILCTLATTLLPVIAVCMAIYTVKYCSPATSSKSSPSFSATPTSQISTRDRTTGS